jgi:hypothetical protein
MGDARGIWFGSFERSVIWLHHAGTLEKHPVYGLPQASASIIDLAGSCSESP